MDQRLQRNAADRIPLWHAHLLRMIARAARGDSRGSFLRPGSPGTAHRLPPARAARPARSRGFFLGAASINDKPRNDVWPRWLALIATFATTATILVLASVPFFVEGDALTVNPGPALVAATSVPPSFISAGTRL